MKNKKYLWDVVVHYVNDRKSVGEELKKFNESFFCTTKQLDEHIDIIERTILRLGGTVAEFEIKLQS